MQYKRKITFLFLKTYHFMIVFLVLREIMRKILIGIILVLLFYAPAPSLAQWVRVYGSLGSDYISSVKTMDDGSIILAGYSKSSYRDINYGTPYMDAVSWIIKLSPSGEHVITYSFRCEWENIDFLEELHSFQIEEDGGFILSGWTNRLGATNLMIVKISPSGDILWNRILGGERQEAGYDIVKTQEGGYVVAGATSSFGSLGTDALVVKLSGEGDIIWQRSYGRVSQDKARSIRQTQDGGFIFVGQSISTSPYDEDIWVVKLSSEGDMEWQKILQGPGVDNVVSVEILGDNSILLAGTIFNDVNGTKDILLVKMSEQGDVESQKVYVWGEDEEATGLVALPDGSCFISATCRHKNIEHLVVLKVELDGEIEWQRYFGDAVFQGEPTREFGSSLSLTPEGDIIVSGEINNLGTSNQNVLLVRLSPDGQIENCNYIQESLLSCHSTSIVVKDSMCFTYDVDLPIWIIDVAHRGHNLDLWVLCPFKKYIPRR